MLGGCGGVVMTRRGLKRFTKCLQVGMPKLGIDRFGRIGKRPFMAERLMSTFAGLLRRWRVDRAMCATGSCGSNRPH